MTACSGKQDESSLYAPETEKETVVLTEPATEAVSRSEENTESTAETTAEAADTSEESTESAAESVTETESESTAESLVFTAKKYYVFGCPPNADEELPITVLAENRDEVNRFIDTIDAFYARYSSKVKWKWREEGWNTTEEASVREVMAAYDDEWFVESQLVIIVREGGSSSSYKLLEIKYVNRTAPDQVEIYTQKILRGWQSADNCVEILLIELPKGSIRAEDTVNVVNDVQRSTES